MDEIFDVHERIDVRNDIEGLIRIYPTVRAIVTSRYESYTEVKMDGRLFEVVELKNFQDDQVKLYTEKWYSLEEQDPNVRNPELNDCLQQLERVDAELKYNPLLLSLILILYRNALEIPTSKLEIYENCTTTIMEYRDTKEKKLNFGLGVTNPLAVFSALAFWQFENDEKRVSVNHIEVHKFLKRYFLDKGVFEDPNISSKEATLFLDFAKLRSLYFENKFTHKTFLEFFTANYLYSTYYLKPNNQHLFKEVVTKNIGIASWNVVLELLISLIDQGQIDFEVIDQLLEQQLNDNPIAASQFFLNLLRYLKNVSPAKIELLLSRGISICIEQHGVKGKFSSVQRIFELIVSLAKLPRFMPLIEKAFLGLQEASGDNFEELSVFAYELSIVSGESFLVNALKRLSVHNSTDYLHLLRNYDALLTKESYLKEIAFLVKQGKGGSFFQDQFSSWFGQKLFFGSNTFNYPLSFLLTRDMQHINEDYQKLKDAGISFHDIFAAARTSFPLARILPETFLDSYGMLKHKELIRIVKSVQLVNSSSVRMEKSNSKFYDALFTKPGYNKR